ncbi:MAG: hypothetical protein ACXW1U_19200 [Methylobacter sp.]
MNVASGREFRHHSIKINDSYQEIPMSSAVDPIKSFRPVFGHNI